MNKKTAPITILLVLLLSAIIITALAQARIVGVTEGEWYKHSEITVEWNTNDTSATFPPSGWEWIEEWNQTEWMTSNVATITSTNITALITQHFKNDTEKTRIGWIDIDTGNSSQLTNETMDMAFMYISANLEENNTIYTTGYYSNWKINETITRIYPDGTRNTNHINITYGYSYSNAITFYYYYSMNYYWDRNTGILVEWTIQSTNHTNQYLTTWSVTSKITESNIWTVPEFPVELSTLLALMALTTTVIIYKRKLNPQL
jgi:hypothetical protein